MDSGAHRIMRGTGQRHTIIIYGQLEFFASARRSNKHVYDANNQQHSPQARMSKRIVQKPSQISAPSLSYSAEYNPTAVTVDIQYPAYQEPPQVHSPYSPHPPFFISTSKLNHLVFKLKPAERKSDGRPSSPKTVVVSSSPVIRSNANASAPGLPSSMFVSCAATSPRDDRTVTQVLAFKCLISRSIIVRGLSFPSMSSRVLPCLWESSAYKEILSTRIVSGLHLAV